MRSYLYDAKDRSTYRVMNQSGVSQAEVPGPTTHNACWDAVLGPDGEVYLSLCSELTTSEYAVLAKYDPEEGHITRLHYTKDLIFSNERYIRDSKIHTSMAWMNDGRLVMLTHTTDRSPEHPAWMPLAYYTDPWTGYPGSSLLTYDPVSGTMENRGIPVHRETLYGAAYDRTGNVYYAIGFLKGHLYGIDLDKRSVRDYGQVAEQASYRLVVGSDGNIYFTTRNGLLQRVNVRTREVENLHIQLPYRTGDGRFHAYLSYAVNGSDGRLYMAGMHDTRLSCYDPATGAFEILGEYLPAEQYAEGICPRVYMGCMGFDREDVLYYVICANHRGGEDDLSIPSMLMRWDLKNGKEPEVLGFPGTPERVAVRSAIMLMDHARDRMYIIGTNHADDGPHVTRVDLAAYRGAAAEAGPLASDPLLFPGSRHYEEHVASLKKGSAFLRQNPALMKCGKTYPVFLWSLMEDGEIENAAVRRLFWEGGRLHAVCGTDRSIEFILSGEGQILSRRTYKAEDEAVSGTAADAACDPELLPAYPGRQYKRAAHVTVPLTGGRQLAATEDGMLAIVKEGKAYSLGIVWPNGPVNAMSVTEDLRTVYGVAGDRDDIGVVFKYSDEEGLRILGHAGGFDEICGAFNSPYLTACAVNGSGTVLAVGAGGRMGCVYLYHLS